MKKQLKKIHWLRLGLVGILLLTQSVVVTPLAALPQVKTVWGERSIPSPDRPFVLPPATRFKPVQQNLRLNPFGTLRPVGSSKKPENSPHIIHVNDIHDHPQAQSNISQMIQTLIQDQAVDLIALEGAFGPVNVSDLKHIPHTHILQEVADYFLNEKEMSGPLHAILTANGDLPVVIGVDDQMHYREHVQSVRAAERQRNGLKGLLQRTEDELARRKKENYSATLYAFDQNVQRYQREELSFGDYVSLLNQIKPLEDKHIQSYLNAFQIEKILDFKKIEHERSRWIAKFLKYAGPKEKKKFYDQSKLYVQGQLSHADFYRSILGISTSQLKITQFPAFNAYLQYIFLVEDIDAAKLFEEINQQEQNVYDSLAKTEIEKQIVQKSRRHYLTKKLINFALTRNEWKEYRRGEPVARPTALLQKKVSTHLGEAPPRPYTSFESFYHQAEIRDQKMAQNLSAAIKKHKAQKIILVTGGYHASGIQSQLKDANILSFTPRITQIESKSGTEYLSAFSQEKTPLEQLMAGDPLFLARPVLPRAKKYLITASMWAYGAALGFYQDTGVFFKNIFSPYDAALENSTVTLQNKNTGRRASISVQVVNHKLKNVIQGSIKEYSFIQPVVQMFKTIPPKWLVVVSGLILFFITNPSPEMWVMAAGSGLAIGAAVMMGRDSGISVDWGNYREELRPQMQSFLEQSHMGRKFKIRMPEQGFVTAALLSDGTFEIVIPVSLHKTDFMDKQDGNVSWEDDGPVIEKLREIFPQPEYAADRILFDWFIEAAISGFPDRAPSENYARIKNVSSVILGEQEKADWLEVLDQVENIIRDESRDDYSRIKDVVLTFNEKWFRKYNKYIIAQFSDDSVAPSLLDAAGIQLTEEYSKATLGSTEIVAIGFHSRSYPGRDFGENFGGDLSGNRVIFFSEDHIRNDINVSREYYERDIHHADSSQPLDVNEMELKNHRSRMRIYGELDSRYGAQWEEKVIKNYAHEAVLHEKVTLRFVQLGITAATSHEELLDLIFSEDSRWKIYYRTILQMGSNEKEVLISLKNLLVTLNSIVTSEDVGASLYLQTQRLNNVTLSNVFEHIYYPIMGFAMESDRPLEVDYDKVPSFADSPPIQVISQLTLLPESLIKQRAKLLLEHEIKLKLDEDTGSKAKLEDIPGLQVSYNGVQDLEIMRPLHDFLKKTGFKGDITVHVANVAGSILSLDGDLGVHIGIQEELLDNMDEFIRDQMGDPSEFSAAVMLMRFGFWLGEFLQDGRYELLDKFVEMLPESDKEQWKKMVQEFKGQSDKIENLEEKGIFAYSFFRKEWFAAHNYDFYLIQYQKGNAPSLTFGGLRVLNEVDYEILGQNIKFVGVQWLGPRGYPFDMTPHRFRGYPESNKKTFFLQDKMQMDFLREQKRRSSLSGETAGVRGKMAQLILKHHGDVETDLDQFMVIYTYGVLNMRLFEKLQQELLDGVSGFELNDIGFLLKKQNAFLWTGLLDQNLKGKSDFLVINTLSNLLILSNDEDTVLKLLRELSMVIYDELGRADSKISEMSDAEAIYTFHLLAHEMGFVDVLPTYKGIEFIKSDRERYVEDIVRKILDANPKDILQSARRIIQRETILKPIYQHWNKNLRLEDVIETEAGEAEIPPHTLHIVWENVDPELQPFIRQMLEEAGLREKITVRVVENSKAPFVKVNDDLSLTLQLKWPLNLRKQIEAHYAGKQEDKTWLQRKIETMYATPQELGDHVLFMRLERIMNEDDYIGGLQKMEAFIPDEQDRSDWNQLVQRLLDADTRPNHIDVTQILNLKYLEQRNLATFIGEESTGWKIVGARVQEKIETRILGKKQVTLVLEELQVWGELIVDPQMFSHRYFISKRKIQGDFEFRNNLIRSTPTEQDELPLNSRTLHPFATLYRQNLRKSGPYDSIEDIKSIYIRIYNFASYFMRIIEHKNEENMEFSEFDFRKLRVILRKNDSTAQIHLWANQSKVSVTDVFDKIVLIAAMIDAPRPRDYLGSEIHKIATHDMMKPLPQVETFMISLLAQAAGIIEGPVSPGLVKDFSKDKEGFAKVLEQVVALSDDELRAAAKKVCENELRVKYIGDPINQDLTVDDVYLPDEVKVLKVTRPQRGTVEFDPKFPKPIQKSVQTFLEESGYATHYRVRPAQNRRASTEVRRLSAQDEISIDVSRASIEDDLQLRDNSKKGRQVRHRKGLPKQPLAADQDGPVVEELRRVMATLSGSAGSAGSAGTGKKRTRRGRILAEGDYGQIERLITELNGNVSAAAKALDVTVSSLQAWLEQHSDLLYLAMALREKPEKERLEGLVYAFGSDEHMIAFVLNVPHEVLNLWLSWSEFKHVRELMKLLEDSGELINDFKLAEAVGLFGDDAAVIQQMWGSVEGTNLHPLQIREIIEYTLLGLKPAAVNPFKGFEEVELDLDIKPTDPDIEARTGVGRTDKTAIEFKVTIPPGARWTHLHLEGSYRRTIHLQGDESEITLTVPVRKMGQENEFGFFLAHMDEKRMTPPSVYMVHQTSDPNDTSKNLAALIAGWSDMIAKMDSPEEVDATFLPIIERFHLRSFTEDYAKAMETLKANMKNSQYAGLYKLLSAVHDKFQKVNEIEVEMLKEGRSLNFYEKYVIYEIRAAKERGDKGILIVGDLEFDFETLAMLALPDEPTLTVVPTGRVNEVGHSIQLTIDDPKYVVLHGDKIADQDQLLAQSKGKRRVIASLGYFSETEGWNARQENLKTRSEVLILSPVHPTFSTRGESSEASERIRTLEHGFTVAIEPAPPTQVGRLAHILALVSDDEMFHQKNVKSTAIKVRNIQAAKAFMRLHRDHSLFLQRRHVWDPSKYPQLDLQVPQRGQYPMTLAEMAEIFSVYLDYPAHVHHSDAEHELSLVKDTYRSRRETIIEIVNRDNSPKMNRLEQLIGEYVGAGKSVAVFVNNLRTARWLHAHFSQYDNYIYTGGSGSGRQFQYYAGSSEDFIYGDDGLPKRSRKGHSGRKMDSRDYDMLKFNQPGEGKVTFIVNNSGSKGIEVHTDLIIHLDPPEASGNQRIINGALTSQSRREKVEMIYFNGVLSPSYLSTLPPDIRFMYFGQGSHERADVELLEARRERFEALYELNFPKQGSSKAKKVSGAQLEGLKPPQSFQTPDHVREQYKFDTRAIKWAGLDAFEKLLGVSLALDQKSVVRQGRIISDVRSKKPENEFDNQVRADYVVSEEGGEAELIFVEWGDHPYWSTRRIDYAEAARSSGLNDAGDGSHINISPTTEIRLLTAVPNAYLGELYNKDEGPAVRFSSELSEREIVRKVHQKILEIVEESEDSSILILQNWSRFFYGLSQPVELRPHLKVFTPNEREDILRKAWELYISKNNPIPHTFFTEAQVALERTPMDTYAVHNGDKLEVRQYHANLHTTLIEDDLLAVYNQYTHNGKKMRYDDQVESWVSRMLDTRVKEYLIQKYEREIEDVLLTMSEAHAVHIPNDLSKLRILHREFLDLLLREVHALTLNQPVTARSTKQLAGYFQTEQPAHSNMLLMMLVSSWINPPSELSILIWAALVAAMWFSSRMPTANLPLIHYNMGHLKHSKPLSSSPPDPADSKTRMFIDGLWRQRNTILSQV